MKRLSLILLSLILCLTLCITGCNGDDETTTAQKGPGSNGGSNGTTVQSISKGDAVEIFNSFDINTVFDSAELTPEVIFDNIANLTFGAEAIMKPAEGADATASIAMKNGLIYYETTDAPAYYVYVGDSAVTLFAQGEDGAWAPYNPTAQPAPAPEIDVSGNEPVPYTVEVSETPSILDLSEYSAMLEMVKEYASMIVLPELKTADLAEENGMFVVSYDYLVQLLRANASFIMGTDPSVEIPKEELDEAMKEVEPSLKAVGLKIAFAANDDGITKLSLSIKFDNSDMGKMFKEEANFSAMSLTAEFVNGGKALKKISATVDNDYSALEKGYAPKTAMDISYILNDKFEPVGIKSDATLYMISQMGRSTSDTSQSGNGTVNEQAFATVFKVTVKASADLSKLDAKNAELASVAITIKPEKSFKTSNNYNVVDYEYELVSSKTEATSLTGNNVEITAKVNAKGEGNFNLAATVKVNNESSGITANAYTESAPNFPKEIPAVITEFINAN